MVEVKINGKWVSVEPATLTLDHPEWFDYRTLEFFDTAADTNAKVGMRIKFNSTNPNDWSWYTISAVTPTDTGFRFSLEPAERS